MAHFTIPGVVYVVGMVAVLVGLIYTRRRAEKRLKEGWTRSNNPSRFMRTLLDLGNVLIAAAIGAWVEHYRPESGTILFGLGLLVVSIGAYERWLPPRQPVEHKSAI